MTEAVQVAIVGAAASVLCAVVGAGGTVWAAYIGAKKKEAEEQEKAKRRPYTFSGTGAMSSGTGARSSGTGAGASRTGTKTVNVRFGNREPEPSKPWAAPLWVFGIILVLGLLATSNAYLNTLVRVKNEALEKLSNPPQFQSAETHRAIGDRYAELGMYDRAEPEYRIVVEANDSDAAARDALAVSLAEQGKLEDALQENIAAVALAEQADAPPEDLALYHNNEGVTLQKMFVRAYDGTEPGAEIETNRLWDAALEYQTAAQLQEDTAEYWHNLASILDWYTFLIANSNLESYASHPAEAFTLSSVTEPAQAAAYRAASLEPENGTYRATYADTLLHSRNYSQALQEARAALALDLSADEKISVYITMGTALNNLGRYEEAVAVRREYLRLEEAAHKPDTSLAIAHYGLGVSLYNWGHYREALKEFQTAIDLDYARSFAHYGMSMTLIELDRYADALDAIDGALERNPDSPDYHYIRAAVLDLLGRKSEAADEYRAAYALGGLDLPEDLAPSNV